MWGGDGGGSASISPFFTKVSCFRSLNPPPPPPPPLCCPFLRVSRESPSGVKAGAREAGQAKTVAPGKERGSRELTLGFFFFFLSFSPHTPPTHPHPFPPGGPEQSPPGGRGLAVVSGPPSADRGGGLGVFSSLCCLAKRSMRPFGSRRRGPPAGRLACAPCPRAGPRALSGVQAGRSLLQLASRCVRGVVLVLPPCRVPERVGAATRVALELRALCSTAGEVPGTRYRSGLCVGRVAPRALRCPVPREVLPVQASVPCARGCRPRAAPGRWGRPSPRERGETRGNGKTVGGRGAAPSAAAAARLGFLPCRLPARCRASRPGEGPRWPGRTRLGGSLPPLARPMLCRFGGGEDGGRSPLPHPAPPSAAQQARRSARRGPGVRGTAQSLPAAGEREKRAGRAFPRLAGDGESAVAVPGEREAKESRRKLRSGPGSLPAAAREGPAAGVGGAPALVPRRPCPRRARFAFAGRRWVAGAAATVAPATALSRGSERRRAAPPPRGGGAARVGRARARRRAAGVRGAGATDGTRGESGAPRVAATWLILPVAYACLKA